MDVEEFAKKVNPKNWYHDSLISTLKYREEDSELAIEPKGDDLVEVVERLKQQKLHPIVDRRFRMVFGVGDHLQLRTDLYRYCYYAGGSDRPYLDPNEAADLYISQNYGYFISKMRPRFIVVGEAYRPDRFDEKLFAGYTLDPQDMNLARFYRERGRGGF